jgi:hypothetical protein
MAAQRLGDRVSRQDALTLLAALVLLIIGMYVLHLGAIAALN